MGMGGGATEGMCTALLAHIYRGGSASWSAFRGRVLLRRRSWPLVMGVFLPTWGELTSSSSSLLRCWRWSTSCCSRPAAIRRTNTSRKEPPALTPPLTLQQMRRTPPACCDGPVCCAGASLSSFTSWPETTLVSFVNLYLFEYRGAPAGCHPGDRLVLGHDARRAAAVQHPALDAGRPQADRRCNVQRRGSHPADHSPAGLGRRAGGDPCSLVSDGRGLADHRGQNPRTTPAGRVPWWGSRWRRDRWAASSLRPSWDCCSISFRRRWLWLRRSFHCWLVGCTRRRHAGGPDSSKLPQRRQSNGEQGRIGDIR